MITDQKALDFDGGGTRSLGRADERFLPGVFPQRCAHRYHALGTDIRAGTGMIKTPDRASLPQYEHANRSMRVEGEGPYRYFSVERLKNTSSTRP
jgi:hypothetical protein